MELQEGDSLMAGSRRRSLLLHGACADTCNTRQTIRVCVEMNFRGRGYVTPAEDQPMKRPNFQFARAM
jgi:hypothetical protein